MLLKNNSCVKITKRKIVSFNRFKENKMPNIKSAEKRVSVIRKKKLQNQMIRSKMNTAVKKFNAAISNNDVQTAEKLLPLTASEIDGAAKAHIIHKNAANHKKAQIAKALYQLQHGIIVVKVDAKTLKQAEQKAAAQKKAEESQAIRDARTSARKEKEAAKAPVAKKKAPAKKPAATETKPAAKKTVKKAPVEKAPEAEVADEVK